MFKVRETTYDLLKIIRNTPYREIKKDGKREPFNRDKITARIKMACQKNPVSIKIIEEFVDSLELYLQELGKKEVNSKKVGESFINRLKKWMK